MYIDWITWSVWTIGLVLLLYWLIKTAQEFRAIFLTQKGRDQRRTGNTE